MVISVLCIGDVIGKPGRDLLKQKMSALKEEYRPDFIVANAENSAKGAGITRKSYQELSQLGIEALTGGDHTYDKKESLPQFEQFFNFVRPLNYPTQNPGKGYRVFLKNGIRIAVVSILGQVFMRTLLNCPFQTLEAYLGDISQQSDVIMVDCHTEATSEIQALGWFLDGKVALVFGTHTHVQTADEKILPKGTGYISDLGMVGSEDSVIGVKKEAILARFLSKMPVRHEPATTPPFILSGIIAKIDSKSGKTIDIQRVLKRYT